MSKIAEAPPTPYDAAFFKQHESGSIRSARAILPVLYEILRPQSVVDVGCGNGTWLAAFQESGVTDIRGIDGAYVPREALQIPAECFSPLDLSRPFALERTFDLAVSLEVAEHLPVESAYSFVQSLSKLAPVILFSAAIPDQVGAHHVNEQWPSYWQALFRTVDFVMLDPIRPSILHDERIEWWYRQNIVVLVRQDLYQGDPRFSPLPLYSDDIFLVGRVTLQHLSGRVNAGLRDTMQRIPGLVAASIRRRLKV